MTRLSETLNELLMDKGWAVSLDGYARLGMLCTLNKEDAIHGRVWMMFPALAETELYLKWDEPYLEKDYKRMMSSIRKMVSTAIR